MNYELKFTSVFDRNIKAYNSGVKLIINQGGTRSSKTWSILQMLYLIALYSKKKLIISIVSHALPHLKLGAIRDFDQILIDSGRNPDSIKNKTDNYYTINKSIIEFFGTDSIDKVHGPTRDILFVNEANYIKYEVYDQLAIRTKDCKIIDFNPSQSFWCHEDVMPLYDHLLIKSTYKDNEHLTVEQIKQIEAKKGVEKFANWWRVYGEGEIGNLEGVIYPDWSYGEFDASLPFGYGLDFGFYPDPDALVKVAIDKRRKLIYLDECLYENNNGTEALRKSLTQCLLKNSLIIADSAEARLISDLSSSFNIRKVVKKPGSVVEGIRTMQDYKFIVTERSSNLVKELKNYIWSDKKAGIPLDAFNHCFVGDTIIDTNRGKIPISNVDNNDKVLTSRGYKRVIKKFDNGLKQVYKYTIQLDANLLSLCCTSDHLIKTTQGWKRISELKSGMRVYLNKSLTENYIDYTQEKDISQGGVRECISQYGNTIMEKSIKGIVYIIKMKINGITESLILNLKNGANISRFMPERGLMIIRNGMLNFKRRGLKLRLNGINPKRVLNGIQNTENQHGIIENTKNLFAKYAGKNIKQDIQEYQNIAVITVKQLHCEEIGLRQVYDLMVDQEHEYFANGILVHNCLDAARYYVMSVVVLNQTRLVSI